MFATEIQATAAGEDGRRQCLLRGAADACLRVLDWTVVERSPCATLGAKRAQLDSSDAGF